MKPVAQWQAVRDFDTECVAYLRDQDGPLVAPVEVVEVEASTYGGGTIRERWTGVVGEDGRLAWTFPQDAKLGPGLYRITVRAGDALVSLGLLEVV